ncbi:MAG: tRNA (N(6)-L-threonylcarbamoyladenosine(37)-C(2))-methylthiotransferase MtaB [Desulfonatronovibrio sp.]
MNFHIITMGCKINQYETQAITESLVRNGYSHLTEPDSAENIIINSCAVTSRAVRDLKKTCRRLGRTCPQSRIIITGCAAQVLEQELTSMNEVHSVIPQNKKTNLLSGLTQDSSDSSAPSDFYISDYFRARAVVKVQDGCSHRCSYCIVPQTRGNPVSRPKELILKEILSLLDKNFSEIILGGINLRLYGQGLSESIDFWDLINYLRLHLPNPIQNKFRLRLSSLEPSELKTKALDTLSKDQLICPHLHISLQSGSTEILRKMNRSHYTPDDLLDFTRQLKSIWQVFALGADILVGFPGETSADFQKTRELVHELPLTYAHVFPYSPRPGTPAAQFKEQINQKEKKYRSADLSNIVQDKKIAFINKICSLREIELSMETPFKGMSQYYVECQVKNSQNLKPRQLIKVKPLLVDQNKLIVQAI